MNHEGTDKASRLRLSESDRLILSLLLQDSRRTISEISSVTGMARAKVRDRITLMKEAGVIRRFTIETGDQQVSKVENFQTGVFFYVELKRPACQIIYTAICAWPELKGCWSVAGKVDMVIRLEAPCMADIERLHNILCRRPEVKNLKTLPILRQWG